jgi:hypothetical protein
MQAEKQQWQKQGPGGITSGRRPFASDLGRNLESPAKSPGRNPLAKTWQ